MSAILRWQDPGAIDPTIRPRAYLGPIPPPKALPPSWVETYRPPGVKSEAELAAAIVAHREDLAGRAARASTARRERADRRKRKEAA